jgi:hypothetical protein
MISIFTAAPRLSDRQERGAGTLGAGELFPLIVEPAISATSINNTEFMLANSVLQGYAESR